MLIPASIDMVACHGVPPTPVVVGMSPQGPALSLLYANMKRREPRCALWAKQVNIILAGG